MFSVPGIALLLVFIYARPQEYFVALQSVPLLYVFLGMALFGAALDLKLGFLKPVLAPQLPLVVAFLAWVVLTLVVKAPRAMVPGLLEVGVPAILFFLLAHCIQSFRALQAILGTILGLVLFLAFVGVHQGLSEFECHKVDWAQKGEVGIRDGRPCDMPRTCRESEGAEPDADYMCEKPGLFDTHSIAHGRVRYRGILQDPNDLTLALCTSIPFAFAFLERKRSASRLMLLLATLGLVGLCTVFSRSRGGQLVFLTGTMAYFLRKYGAKGLLVGAVLAAPMLAFGGRSGGEADGSTLERTRCLYMGMEMFRHSPLLGVGQGQFTEHHHETAHNSYALVAAELGLPGMVLWSSIFYVSLKIPVKAMRASKVGLELAPVARAWGMALVAALSALSVGVFFLSFSYHNVFWIFLGLSGAFYACVRAHEPNFEVKLSLAEVGAIVAADLAIITALTLYAGWKLG